MSTALFDTYVMVDWSAESRPKRGADSIWLARLQRCADGTLAATEPVNPPTRAAASALLEALLDAELAARRRVLLGFDFPFGYPEGFAARLGLSGPAWRAIWQDFTLLVKDDAANSNNRFAVAEQLNWRVSGSSFPFWGRPSGADFPMLAPHHHRRHAAEGLAERRLVDQRVRRSQPAWKLLGIGSAGSQALTGIPVLERLKQRFGGDLQVWPFETGLTAPTAPAIVLAEIYPSLFPIDPALGEVKDAVQTCTTARVFAEQDTVGELARLFAGDPDLTEAERAVVVVEEGWVLGVTGPINKKPARRAGVPPAGGRDACPTSQSDVSSGGPNSLPRGAIAQTSQTPSPPHGGGEGGAPSFPKSSSAGWGRQAWDAGTSV